VSYSLTSGLRVNHRDLHSFPTRRSSDLRNDFSTKFLSYYRVVSSCTTSNFYTFNIFQCVQATTFFRNQSKVRVDVWSRETKFSRSEEHTSELQSRFDLVCRLLLEKKNTH